MCVHSNYKTTTTALPRVVVLHCIQLHRVVVQRHATLQETNNSTNKNILNNDDYKITIQQRSNYPTHYNIYNNTTKYISTQFRKDRISTNYKITTMSSVKRKFKYSILFSMLYLNHNRSFEFISLILPRVVIPISPDVPLGMVRCERSIILSLNGDGMDSRVLTFGFTLPFYFYKILLTIYSIIRDFFGQSITI